MNQYRRMIVASMIGTLLLTSTAMAGGGGSKRDATLRIKNEANVPVGVAVDPSASLLAATTIEQFQARGGKIINPNQTISIKVREGAHRIIAAADIGDPIDDKSVSVGQGQTKTVVVRLTGIVL